MARPPTPRSQLLVLRERTQPQRNELLGALIHRYWMPAYEYIRSQRSVSADDAKDLTLRAVYHSVRGPIACAWSVRAGEVRVEVTLPPGCTALLELPASTPAQIREGGLPLERVAGLSELRAEHARLTAELASGRYVFAILDG